MMPEVGFAAHQSGARHRALQHAGRGAWRGLGIPAAALVLLGLLAGCSSAFDSLPHAVGGLPAEAPTRSANPAAFPEVHNMPPDRRAPVMNAAEQKQAESDLIALRDKQQRTSAELAKQDQESADDTATTVTPAKPAAKSTSNSAKKNTR